MKHNTSVAAPDKLARAERNVFSLLQSLWRLEPELKVSSNDRERTTLPAFDTDSTYERRNFVCFFKQGLATYYSRKFDTGTTIFDGPAGKWWRR